MAERKRPGRMEYDVLYSEAADILNEPGYNAYGNKRIYGVLESGGAVIAIKSTYHLDKYFPYSRIYVIENGRVI